MSQIQFQKLSFNIEQACLLSKVSGQFESGQIHAIVGQNGAGKSTLLRCLTKEWQASSGQIEFSGKLLTQLSFAELALQRAVLSQHQDLAFSFTVEQLVSLGFEARQRAFSEQQLVAVLEAMDITHLKQRDVLSLSGGEQKRAQLARVVAQIWPEDRKDQDEHSYSDVFSGKWLFLDEWSEALDLKHQVHIGALLKQWAKQGLGVVMVSHDLNQVIQLTDTCLLLKAGKLVVQGATCEVMSAENLTQVLDIPVTVLPNQAGYSLVMPENFNR